MTELDADPPDVLTAAHGYLRLGWGIVPLYGVDEAGECGCGEGELCIPKNRGKHPHGTRKGWRVFTSGGDVQAWFDENPGDNVGVTTGGESGMFVVDVDGPVGIASIGALAAEHGGLPPTRMTRTGSNGLHYYFRHPSNFEVRNSTSYLAPGIDVRGKGGMVVAPPSVSGRGPYELLADVDVVDAPGWLLRMLAEHASRVELGHRAEVRTAEPVEAELIPERIANLRRHLVGDGGRHAHFYGLVAACFEAGYTQGQTVTIVAPWCAAVDKFVGRIEQETARTWGKLEAEAQRAEDWVPGLGQPAAPPTHPLGVPGWLLDQAAGLPAPPSYAPVAVQPDPDGLAAPPEVALDLPPTWAPVDLGPILDGTYVPEVAELFPRVDGPCLVYRGRTHSFHGESESGKSLVCQGEAARILRAGGRVDYLDFESDAGAVTARMLELGAPADAVRERFRYRRPDADPSQFPAEREAYGQLLQTEGLDLVVIDGLTDALAVFGAGSNDMDEVTHFLRRFPRLVARRTGAAVIMVDHVTKDADSRGRHAVGSQAKLNGLDGAAYVVEIAEAIGRGMAGTIVLRVAKDRPGGVRPIAGTFRKGDRTQEAARISIDSTGDPVDGVAIRMVVAPPIETGGQSDSERAAKTKAREGALMEEVSQYVGSSPVPVSKAAVEAWAGARGIGRADVRFALSQLDLLGYVGPSEKKRGGANLMVLIKPYSMVDEWVNQGTSPDLAGPRHGAVHDHLAGHHPHVVGGGEVGSTAATPTLPSLVGEVGGLDVSCKRCFRPTDSVEASAFDGRCQKCGREAGMVPNV